MEALRRAVTSVAEADTQVTLKAGPLVDFSLAFESAILTVIPAVLFLVATPLHIVHYRKLPVVAETGIHYWIQIILAFALFALQVARAALWSIAPNGADSNFAAASALSTIAAAAILAMVALEYRHSARGSTWVGGYLSVTCAVDVVKSRSYFMRDDLNTVAGLSVAIAVISFLIVIMNELPKRLLPSVIKKGISREATSGIWNHAFCLWANTIMFMGYTKALNMDHLEPLGPDYDSEELSKQFEERWAKTNKKRPTALFWTCIYTLHWEVLSCLIPRLIVMTTAWAAAFAIQAATAYLGQDEMPRWQATVLILANFSIYAFSLVGKSLYVYHTNRSGTIARGVLVSQIVKKNLALKQSKASENASTTLMGTDVEQIGTVLQELNDYWLSVPECAIDMYFIYVLIGKAFFLPFIVNIICILASLLFQKPNREGTKAWNMATQKRVANIGTVLLQLKGIKMLGLEPVITKYIQRFRVIEMEESKPVRWIRVLTLTVYALQQTYGAVVSFAACLFWTIWRDGIDSPTLFALLALLSMTSLPMKYILTRWPNFGSILACFGRIQEFLLLEERQDPRQLCDHITNAADSSEKTADADAAVDEKIALGSSARVSFDDVSVASLKSTEEEPANVLKNLNFQAHESTVNFVIGPVGCGKSVLLRTILGETTISSGAIRITTDNMAFCDQKAWLPNNTLREAVIGQSEFEEEWYNQVIKACALDYDISIMTDDAKTGNDNGGLLSGGQKQRVALARAVYSRAPILVLDDILSALDRRTSALVFNRLFAPTGLLKSQGRTVIIATHSVEWLNDADQVIRLSMDGTATIHTAKEDIANVRAIEMASQGEGHDDDIEEEEIKPQVAKVEKKEDPTKDNRYRQDWRLYALVFRGVPRGLFIITLILLGLIIVFECFPETWSRIWVAIDTKDKKLFIPMATLGLAHIGVSLVGGYLFHLIVVGIFACNLHETFLKSVMGATLPFLTKAESGDLLNRFSQDMTLFANTMAVNMFWLVIAVFYLLTCLGWLGASASYGALLVPCIAVILWTLQHFYLRTSRQMRILDLNAKTPLYAKISETVHGVEHIRAYGWSGLAHARDLKLLDHSQKSYYYMFAIQRWLNFWLNVIALVVVTVITAIALLAPHTSSQGSLGLGLFAVMFLENMLRLVVLQWTLLETSLGAAARLRRFLDETPQEKDRDGVQNQPETWPSRGMIEFKDVTAKYNDDPETRAAIQNLSLKVEAGQSTAIIGRTGSGKSTVILTLLNFLSYTGRVEIDGVEISDVPRAQLRHIVTSIPQDHVDIPGTVRDNLLPLEIMDEDEVKKQSDSAVIDTLTRVNMWEYVERHGGLDEEITKMEFSAGQRQLLSLARAMLHHNKTGSKIVVMDEATSNMDYTTDTIMHDVMKETFVGCTRIIITHRNTVLSDCDSLVKMEDGKLASEEKGRKAGSSSKEETLSGSQSDEKSDSDGAVQSEKKE